MITIDPALLITAEAKAASALAVQLDRYRMAAQEHVDATARARRYDSGTSLASYVASSNTTWSAEATAFVSWRDAVWAYAYAELDKVTTGTRPQPGVEEFVAELPAMVWPGEEGE